MTSIIDFDNQVWYTGYTRDDLVIEGFNTVQLSYNVDSLMDKIHPHEDDYVLAPVTAFKIPPLDKAKNFYAFMQPVVSEKLFFNRESFIRTPVPLRRARFIQKFNFRKMFTSKGRK